MAITLRSQFNPALGLKSQFLDPADTAMQADQYQAIKDAEQTAFGQGVGRGLHQTPALISSALGQIVEPIYEPAAKPFFDYAAQQQQAAADLNYIGPRSYEDVNSLGSGAQYIAGKIGENIPNMLASTPVGIGARVALRNAGMSAFGKNIAATSAGAFPLQMGEGAQIMREDPTIMASTSPLERLGYAAGYGALTAPMEAADEALLMGRAMGAGKQVKNIFKDGIGATALDATKHVAKAVPEAAVTEGGTEVLQTLTGQGLKSHLNPERDTSKDEKELKEAFFGGWAAGGGTSAVGRGADVAWAQGRGATEAISNLIKDKLLPSTLKDSEDRAILEWDDKDTEQRNQHAKTLADRIFGDPDAPDTLRAKAAEFYDKAERGVKDAYGAFTDTLKEYDYGKRSENNVNHFTDTAKNLWGAAKDTFKGTKENIESSPEDQVMYSDMKGYLDNRSKSARDTEVASRLYGTIKQSLVEDSWHELPWHALEDEFGTIGRATEAVLKMRSNLIRAGHDIKGEPDEFKKLFEATVKNGVAGEKSKMEVVKTYADVKLNLGSDSDVKQVMRHVTNGLSTYTQMNPKQKEAFDSSMTKAFGKNADKVRQALGPKRTTDTGAPLLENEGSDVSNDVLNQVEAPKARFIGSSVKSASKEAASEGQQEDKVSAHGGMWNLGHGDEGTRSEIRARMAQTVRQLRSEGNDVKELTPLEYSEAAGIAPWKVARSLGKFNKMAEGETYQNYEKRRDAEAVAFLEKHPAKMLNVSPKAEKNDTEVNNDTITLLSDNLMRKQRSGESRILSPEEATLVKVALSFNKKGQGAQQRKMLREAGFPNASKIENTPNGVKLINNLNHGGNGRFSVHMKDGTERVLSAQDVIAHMRDQGHKGTPLQLFLNGLSGITTNKDVERVSIKDVWGREDTKGFDNPHFKLTGDLTMGRARKASQRKSSGPDDIDTAADEVEFYKKELEEATASGDEVAIAEAEENYDKAQEHWKTLDAQQAEYEGNGERRAVIGAADEKAVTHRSQDQEVPTDFNAEGTPKQPYGNERTGSAPATDKETKNASGKPELTTLKFNGLHIKTRPGVGDKHFTKPAVRLLQMLRRAKTLLDKNNLPTSTLNVATDYVGRSAAAQRYGDQKARDAFLAIAVNRLFHALADEAYLLKTQANNLPIDQKGPMLEHAKLLEKAAASIHDEAQVWVDNREKMIDLIDKYEYFEPREKVEKKSGSKFEPAPDRYSHREEFLDTLKSRSIDELKADGIARKARLEHLSSFERKSDNLKRLIEMMEQELEWGREELKERMKGEKPAEAKTETKKEPVDAEAALKSANEKNPLLRERRAQAEKLEKEFTEAVDEVAEGAEAKPSNLKDLAAELKKAFGILKDAWVSGELKKGELVAALRAALKAFRAAVGDAADIVAAKIQKMISEYQKVRAEVTHPVQEVKANDEASFANGTSVTEADMKDIRSYIDKVLGPEVAVKLAKDLGGASATWEKGIIRIAAKASNPMSKAHHEAMHEFFQRLLDTKSEAADILSKAASSAVVTRQIEQFFHNDPNYAKIKEALKDPHERVAYMFQLWAAGKLTVGPKTEGVFKKIVTWLRNTFGQLTDSQKAEAIMSHFHEGSMKTPSEVARVLTGDKEYVGKYLERIGRLSQPLSETAYELLQTAQNELLDSGNKGLEKIGRMFSNETSTQDKDMSFLSSKVMKTNQMNDRLFNILKGMDEKDVAAALNGLQTGQVSKDEKIAEAQKRVRKLLDDVYDYLQTAGVKFDKVENYFPRVWDNLAIAENKKEFIDLLMKDSGGKMDEQAATAVANKLIENMGAAPLTEGEWRIGYTPFAAALNERALDFIKSPEFAKFQRKDIADIMTTYIGHAVHRAEYAKRFGEDGSTLRKMMREAVGEEVGKKTWSEAETKAEAKFQAKANELKKTHNGETAEYFKALREAGYPHHEMDMEHVVSELPEAEKKVFDQFKPKLRRARRAIMAMEGTLGADINPTFRKWTAGLIVYENMRMLLLSLFSQVIDPLGVMVRGGSVGRAWDTFKRGMAGTVAGWRGKPLEDSATQLAMKLGIIDAGNFLNSQGQAYSSVFMGKRAKWWNDRLFRTNGVEGFSQGTRVGAMLAAIEFIKAHSTLPEAHSKRWLAELGLEASDIKLVDGELDYADKKVQNAIFRWVDSAVLRPNAALRPSWASDPHFALIFHMKQFTYAFHKVLLERVANEMKHDNYDPMLTMVLTYVPAMVAADFLRGLVSNGGEEPPWKRDWTAGDYITEGVQRAGLLGIPQFGLDVAKWGPAELGGPVIEQAHKATQNYTKSASKDRRLDEKFAQSQKPADQKAAEEYNWFVKGTEKTLRQAIPTGEMMKRVVYDPMVKETEAAV